MAETKKWWVSSANPEQLSLTIKGMLLAFVPFILLVVNAFGIDLGEGQIQELIESIAALGGAAVGVISAAMVAYGLARKIIIKFLQKPE
mgnify:CR=1 FL=1